MLFAALVVVSALPLLAQQPPQASAEDPVRANYTKYEYQIPMRDGVKLFTAVYVPKDTSQAYPIMLSRTPYSVSPYGVDQYRRALGPSEYFMKDGFIFVYQDVRGRYMSEGTFVEMTPHLDVKKGPKDIDESSDTYDTIDWLIKNIPRNNGKVGMWGISYPGFYTAAGLPDAHPALKASSPQAPIADLFRGDDAFHNGAFMLAANFGFYVNFTPRKAGPEPPSRGPEFDYGTPDGYEFYLKMGSLGDSDTKYIKGQNHHWTANLDHTTYDAFWKARALPPHLKNITPAVLVVGGWFDAEDLQGPLSIYRTIEKSSPNATNMLVMGPWPHGGWAGGAGDRLGNLSFATRTSEFFREHIEFPFFVKYLKDKPQKETQKGAPQEALPEAYVFETGRNVWHKHSEWPPKEAKATAYYFQGGQKLGLGAPGDAAGAGASAVAGSGAAAAGVGAGAKGAGAASSASGGAATAAAAAGAYDEYVSDPNRPVPYLSYTAQGMNRDYMTEDQRFASTRPDVLVYETEPVADDVTIAGPIKVNLQVSTSGTDSDFVVKVIDVYPGDFPAASSAAAGAGAGAGGASGGPPPPNAVRMGGYQQLVRGEPFRGKFRNSFEKPEPFTPNQPAAIAFEMPDVYHTFRKGHRIMVQVQSSWFPLVDRNPQKFLDIPKATAQDFQKATQRVYRSKTLPSSVTFLIVPATLGESAAPATTPTPASAASAAR
jgi:putative CocE/NonD family hydrolase